MSRLTVGGKIACGDQRLEQQPVDGFVQVLERREVDLPIPAREELVVPRQPVGERIADEDVVLGGPADEPAPDVVRTHA